MTDTKKSNFVETSVKFLARYAPATASGGLFFLSLKDAEWIKVIISIPPIILSTIWAAYSKAFLDRLTEIYTEEGKKGADAFKRFTDSLIEAITWDLSAKNDKYLKCQSYPCYDYQIEGLNQSFIPQLEEIFVPLELDLNSGLKESNLSYRSEINTSQNNSISIWDILNIGKNSRTYRRLLIKSQGGYGKTTLLRHITYLYTQKCQRKDVPKLLPVLLRLRKWQTEIHKENAPDLPTLIEKYHIPNLPDGNDFQLPSSWAKNNLDKGKFLILWDGFDEVKPEFCQSISQWLGQQMFNYPNSFFILTSRPKGYNEGYSSEHKPNATLYIKKFNQNQIKNFVHNWYLCQESFARGGQKTPYVIQEAERKTENLLQQLEERKELADLGTNPLLLNMIAKIHRFYPSDKLPQRRTELYQEIFKLQLGDRPLFRQIEMLLSATDSQQILQEIALLMVQVNQTTLEYEELEALVQNAINSLDESVNCQEFIKQIEEVSELLIKWDDYYEFAHLSFQNYLAAKEIQRTNQENLILTHWPDSDIWKETTRLYVAQLRNPSNFIRRLIENKNSEAINLAYECLQETSRQLDLDIDEELKLLSSTVQDARYYKLEKMLKNQQFKDADDETYRLMIETVGKEYGQHFDREELEIFPCKDCRIGWGETYNHWSYYCDLTGEVHDSTPIGHLPLGSLVTERGLRFYYLLERLVICKI